MPPEELEIEPPSEINTWPPFNSKAEVMRAMRDAFKNGHGHQFDLMRRFSNTNTSIFADPECREH